MKRLHKLAATAAVLAIVALGSGCSDVTGTEEWWDEDDQAAFMSEYQAPAPTEQPAEDPVQPRRKDAQGNKDVEY